MKNGAQVILFKNDQRKEVFLVRRTDFPVWGETGGEIEEGEKPSETTIREAMEETGFTIKLGKLLLIYELFNNKGEVIKKEHVFEGRVLSGEYKPEFCRESHG